MFWDFPLRTDINIRNVKSAGRRDKLARFSSFAFPLLICMVILGILYFRSSSNEVAASTKFTDDSIQMIVHSNQDFASKMKESSFKLTLTDSAGIPIQSADLQAFLLMPNMLCGSIPTRIAEDEEQPGTYTIVGVPVMQGSWEAQISLKETGRIIHVEHPFIVK